MSVNVEKFGTSREEREIFLYTISNSKGMQVAVTNLGVNIVKVIVPDANGKMRDVVLGYDEADRYYDSPSFFGATIGPNANRIAGAEYEIDGVGYELSQNDGENNLHSHIELGYHKRMWSADVNENEVVFSLEDPATIGFPGFKTVSVAVSLTEENELKLHYHATSSEATIINLTNHSYFNLDGADSGIIEDHMIQILASKYTPTVPGAIPTGEIADVAGTPMDLTTKTRVGEHIDDAFDQLTMAGGYDHNYCIDGWDGNLRECATVWAHESGIVMKVYTDLPGVQFYSGNFITPEDGKDGAHYIKRQALCLETQYYPDTIHHENFPSCIFGGEEDGRIYDTTTVYAFSVQ